MSRVSFLLIKFLRRNIIDALKEAGILKIMMSAGESSGDVHGAGLAREIKKISPATELFGLGGNLMESAGVKIVRNYKNYNVMGVVEVIKNLRKILKLLDDLTEIIRAEKPDLLVLIDYPDFNWRLAKRAKKLGVKVLSYIPPSAWAWRKGRAKTCTAIADIFIAIFPFENFFLGQSARRYGQAVNVKSRGAKIFRRQRIRTNYFAHARLASTRN